MGRLHTISTCIFENVRQLTRSFFKTANFPVLVGRAWAEPNTCGGLRSRRNLLASGLVRVGGWWIWIVKTYEQTEQTKSSGLAISNESLATKREFI